MGRVEDVEALLKAESEGKQVTVSRGEVTSRVKVIKVHMQEITNDIDYFLGTPVQVVIDAGFTKEFVDALTVLESTIAMFNKENHAMVERVRKLVTDDYVKQAW